MSRERRISRRAFLEAGAVLAGAGALTACTPDAPSAPDGTPSPLPTPALRTPNTPPTAQPSNATRAPVETRPAPAASEKSKTAFQQIWAQLPSVERVRMIEKRQIPESETIDLLQELIRASAELYCENAPVACSGSERSKQVKVLSTQRFVEEIETHDGPITSSQQRKRVEEGVLERVIQKPPLVLINQGAFDLQLRNSSMAPEQLKIINEKGISISWSFLKHVLLHAFAHLDQTDEQYVTPQVRVDLPGSSQYLTVNRLEGFKIIGTSPAGTRSFNGGNEAFTEYVIDEISKMTVGFDLSEHSHQFGLALLLALNKKAGVSDRQAKDMYYKRQSVKNLITAWGTIVQGNNPIEEKGIELFTMFSLTAGGIIPSDIGKKELEKRIGQPL